jgi:hypothetical protein
MPTFKEKYVSTLTAEGITSSNFAAKSMQIAEDLERKLFTEDGELAFLAPYQKNDGNIDTKALKKLEIDQLKKFHEEVKTELLELGFKVDNTDYSIYPDSLVKVTLPSSIHGMIAPLSIHMNSMVMGQINNILYPGV